MNKDIVDILKQHNLRKTAIRAQVLEVFLQEGNKAIAHPDMERLLPHADRITLYRTLKTFEEKGIIHQVVDGSNAAKYALCQDTCTEHEHHDEHAHFHCQDCGKTICLDSTVQSNVQVPQGFSVKQTHLVLEGTCNDCDE
ncbi:MAG: transcriptional repressor [Bacteroidota bacterium]